MAGRFSVEAVFKAVDRVTAPVTRMQNRVGKFTRGIERGLRSANRMLSKFTRGIARGARAALKFGGVAITAGLVAVTLAMNKTADAADALAKRSRRLQFPIEDLQEWQFVAEQSGLSTEAFDKAIEKFTKSVGEARAGTGTLITILKKSNPQLLKQITNADNAADAFDIYMKAMRGTENQMDKTALATAAFGRTGAKFLNITEQSADAVKALRKEQRENGVITKEQAQAAEAYNDAVNSLKKSLKGVLDGVLLPMFPVITKTIRAWRDWIVSNKDLIKTKINEFLIVIKDSVLQAWEALKKFNAEQSILERLKSIITGISDAFTFLAKHDKTVLAIVAAIVALSIALKVFTVIMTIVNLVMAANPIVLIILGIGLLIAAVAALIFWWDDLKQAFLDSSAGKATIKWLTGAATFLMKKWEPVKKFFNDLWDGIVSKFEKATVKIKAIIGKISGAVSFVTDTASGVGSDVADFFGFGDDEEEQSGTKPQMVSPQDRIARSIEEQRTTSTAEVTIRDESGRAELTGGQLGPGLKLQATGAM